MRRGDISLTLSYMSGKITTVSLIKREQLAIINDGATATLVRYDY